MLVCCLKSNHISNVKNRLFKSVLDLRDLYSFRSSSAPDCWCKWHNPSLWKLRDPKRIWKEVINSVSLFVCQQLWSSLTFVFSSRFLTKAELKNSLSLLFSSCSRASSSSLCSSVSCSWGKERNRLLCRTDWLQNLWAPPGLGSDYCSHLFVSLQVRWQLLRPGQSSRWRAVENTLRLWQRERRGTVTFNV